MNKKWSKDKVLAEIRALADKYGCAQATQNEALYHAARKHIGSWSEACKQAGVPMNERWKKCKVKKDCLLYDEERAECKGLRSLECVRGECAFYKKATKESLKRYEEDMAVIEARRKDKYFEEGARNE